MQAAGIEPAADGEAPRAKFRQDGSKVGQDRSQVGHVEGVADCPMCKGRTGGGLGVSKAGRETSTTGAQRKTTAVLRAAPGSAQLAAIVDAWPKLPEPVREAVVAIVRALQHGPFTTFSRSP